MADLETQNTAALSFQPEALARTLRHEIGDFLQKVYASVAVLQSRLPPEADLEREILTRLHKGAESCKHLLDAIQDFLGTMILSRQTVDLGDVTWELVVAAQARFPQRKITAETVGPVHVAADPQRMKQVGQALLVNACEAAQRDVRFLTRISGDEAEWIVRDDGPGISSVGDRLFVPFVTMQAGHLGLGLALAQRIVRLHEGEINIADRPEGGCEVCVRLPLKPSG
jgi:signal transduction histidine kinase